MKDEAVQRATRLRARRGYTLLELLLVIAMIAVLASLAFVGFRKYMSSAETADVITMMSSIRSSEASYKQETLVYLGCSPTLTSYYPQTTSKPDQYRWRWEQPAHPQYNCWQRLSVENDKVTRFGFAVVAGGAGDPVPQVSLTNAPVWPNPTTAPWYVVQAAGDRDADLAYSLFVTSSFSAVTGNTILTQEDFE